MSESLHAHSKTGTQHVIDSCTRTPEALVAKLTPAELASVLAYLESLKGL